MEAGTASQNKNRKEEIPVKAAWKRVIGTALVAVVLLSGATVAFAAPREDTAMNASGGPRGANPHLVLAYIAGKTDVEMSALVEEYKSGMTLQEICEAHGVEWAEVEGLLGPNTADRIERIKERIARLTENQAKVQEHIAKLTEDIARLQERIPNMENPARKGFAERQLEVMESRLALCNQKLDFVGQQLALLQDMLAYLETL